MAHRDFVVPLQEKDPPSFSIAGREFKCLVSPPAGILTDVIAAAEGSVAIQTTAVVQFLQGCLEEAAAEAFHLLIYDKDTLIPLESLVEIAQWLVEEYTGRPTTPSSGSPAGSATTPATPVDGSDSPAST